MSGWGGAESLNTGGQYAPVADSWSSTTMANVPAGRQRQSAVWTGSRMIVWGGLQGGFRLNTGGQYDPAGNAWTATATSGAPTGRYLHAAVWTGSKMIIWGGFDGTSSSTGGLYTILSLYVKN